MSILPITAPRERRSHAPRWRPGATVVFIAAMALSASPALADICKYIDTAGNIHYSNVPPEKGWKRVSCSDSDNGPQKRLAPVESVSTRTAPTPTGFPRVDAGTQKGRDDVRRKVLIDELATEDKLLAEARTVYADGAPMPLPDERANADKYRERIGKLRQIVSVHQKNIDALKKEIVAVK